MTALTDRAARGTLWHMLAQGTVTLSAYIVAVILARSLGPVAYGVYGLIYSLLMTVELVGRLGIPQAVSRLLAARAGEQSRLEATGFALTGLVYLFLFAAFWLAAPGLAAAMGLAVEEGSWLLRLAALDIPFFGLFFMAVHVLNGHRAFARGAMGNILYALTKAVGIGLLALYGATVAGALLVNVLGSLVGLALLLLLIGRISFALDCWLARRILTLALPIGLTGFGTQLLSSLDLWSLSLFGRDIPEVVRGYYVAALSLARMPNLLAFVMTAVLVPTLARTLADGHRDLARHTLAGALRFLALILLPSCVLIAIEAEPLLQLLFSVAYVPAAGLLQLLVFGHGLLNTLFVIATAVLIAVDAQRTAALIALAAVPAALATNALLVPTFGAPGAAMAAVLVPLWALVTAGRALAQRLAWRPDRAMLGRAAAITMVIASLAWLLPSQGLWLLPELASLALLLLLLAVLMGLLGWQDLAFLLPARLQSRWGLGSVPAEEKR